MYPLNKKLVEKKWRDLINERGLGDVLSVEKIKGWVFNDDGDAREAHLLFGKKILNYFPDLSNTDDLNEVYQMITDIWNVFPHKSLAGKSPQEMMEKALKENPELANKKQEKMPDVIVGGKKMTWQENQELLKTMEKAQKPFKDFIDKEVLPVYVKLFEQKTFLSKEAKEKYVQVARIFFERVLWVGFADYQSIRPEFAKNEFPRWWQSHVAFSRLDENQVWSVLKCLIDFMREQYGLEMMGQQGYSVYPPRDEYEMCELFGDLLLMNFPAEDQGVAKEMTMKARFTEKEIAWLDKEYLLNRVFRRWWQTTWGFSAETHSFGETPRQELARLNPKINQGSGYLSVRYEITNDSVRMTPRYFEGDIFDLALNSAQGEPHFDKEFKTFIDWLDLSNTQNLAIATSQESAFTSYLAIFWQGVPGLLFLNCGANLNESQFVEICGAARDFLKDFCVGQRNEQDFLKFDDLFFGIWEIFRCQKNMPSYEEMSTCGETKAIGTRLRKDPSFKKALESFYRLGVALDRYFLFPLDRYFSGAEIVWTDQQNFFNDYVNAIFVMRGDDPLTKGYKKDPLTLDVADIAFDLKYLWFAPCSYFRLLGRTFKYLH